MVGIIELAYSYVLKGQGIHLWLCAFLQYLYQFLIFDISCKFVNHGSVA